MVRCFVEFRRALKVIVVKSKLIVFGEEERSVFKALVDRTLLEHVLVLIIGKCFG